MKILAVEDDPTAALVIAGILKSLGHDVTLASDVAGAHEVLRTNPIRMVVCDWQMQGADGLDFCRALRSRPGDYIYFILLTQQEPTEANERLAIEAGVDDFLTKPARVRDIRSRLHVAERILRYTEQIKQLETFIPICSHCKNIRDDKDYWQQIELYISQRTGSRFSHGICPDCYRNIVLPDLVKHGSVDSMPVPVAPPAARSVSPRG